MRTFLYWILSLFILLSLTACQSEHTAQVATYIDLNQLEPLPAPAEKETYPLRVAIAAVISPQGSAESYAPLLDYLSEELGRPVESVQRRTYAEMEKRANRLAHHLAAAGVGPGDHVGIYAYNSVEWVEILWAVFKIRAVWVNINYRYVADELAYIVHNADLVALVYELLGPTDQEIAIVEGATAHHSSTGCLRRCQTSSPGFVPWRLGESRFSLARVPFARRPDLICYCSRLRSSLGYLNPATCGPAHDKHARVAWLPVH